MLPSLQSASPTAPHPRNCAAGMPDHRQRSVCSLRSIDLTNNSAVAGNWLFQMCAAAIQTARRGEDRLPYNASCMRLWRRRDWITHEAVVWNNNTSASQWSRSVTRRSSENILETECRKSGLIRPMLLAYTGVHTMGNHALHELTPSALFSNNGK